MWLKSFYRQGNSGIKKSSSWMGHPSECYWEGWQRVEMEKKSDTAAKFQWWDGVTWRTKQNKTKKRGTTKDTDGRHADMSISETEVVVLDPNLVVPEKESGTKAMENTEVPV